MCCADLADLREPAPCDTTKTTIYEQCENEAFPV